MLYKVSYRRKTLEGEYVRDRIIGAQGALTAILSFFVVERIDFDRFQACSEKENRYIITDCQGNVIESITATMLDKPNSNKS